MIWVVTWYVLFFVVLAAVAVGVDGLQKELRYAQESQDRLVDALKACKERNGEPTN